MDWKLDDVVADGEVMGEAPVSAPAWRQLGVIVMDGSESMTWQLAADASLDAVAPARTKGEGVAYAVNDFVSRMRASAKVANFSGAFVTYNDRVTWKSPPRDFSAIDPMAENFDPTSHGIGGTRLHTGLETAVEIVEEYFRTQAEWGLPVSAVVAVMSDGEDAEPAKALEVAARLKALPNTVLASCLFATKGQPTTGASLLQSLVSEPRLYQTVYDASQLRDFFHKSMTTTALAALPSGQ